MEKEGGGGERCRVALRGVAIDMVAARSQMVGGY